MRPDARKQTAGNGPESAQQEIRSAIACLGDLDAAQGHLQRAFDAGVHNDMDAQLLSRLAHHVNHLRAVKAVALRSPA